MSDNHHYPRYALIAQNRQDQLIVKILAQEQYFEMSAREILNHTELLPGFLPIDAAIIGFVAGMSVAEKLAV